MSENVIWKTSIVPGRNVVSVPFGAKILCVQSQFSPNEKITVWFLCNPKEAQKSHKTFWVTGTGQSFDELEGDFDYLGTVQMNAGTLVWHIFEGPAE